MPTLNQLRKQANAAPKYIFELKDAEGFYLDTTGENVTQDETQAMQFAVGYDNEAMKLQYWQSATNAELTIKYI